MMRSERKAAPWMQITCTRGLVMAGRAGNSLDGITNRPGGAHR